MQNSELIALVADLMAKVEAKNKEIISINEANFWQLAEVVGLRHDNEVLEKENAELKLSLQLNKKAVIALETELAGYRTPSQYSVKIDNNGFISGCGVANGSAIFNGTLSAGNGKFDSSTVAANTLKVDSLSAINFPIGHITSGNIFAGSINTKPIWDLSANGFVSNSFAMESVGLDPKQFEVELKDASTWDCGQYEEGGKLAFHSHVSIF